jgi:ATP-dependent protease HslVU (ClpYQ) peptidase subunit
MTTIIAAQGEKWAVVGYDSLVSDESGRSFTLGRGSSKVVKNGQYLLGAAGDVRAINILAHVFAPPKPNELTGTRLDKFVTSKFVPALRACFEDQGYAPRDTKDQGAQHGSVVLVVVNGTIYEIDEDYSWVRGSTGVYAVGTGGDVALGAMYAMTGEQSFDEIGLDRTKKIVKDCLAIAVKLDNQSGGPLHVTYQVSP